MTKEELIIIARSFKDRRTWLRKNRSSYELARDLGYLADILLEVWNWSDPRKEKRVSVEEIIQRVTKFSTLAEAIRNDPSAYSRFNKLPNVTELKDKYFPDRLKFESKKYEDLQKIAAQYESRTEWAKKDISSYHRALKNLSREQVAEICSHMIQFKRLVPRQKKLNYTYEECEAVAKKYTETNMFYNENKALVMYAHRKGWRTQLQAHMKQSVFRYENVKLQPKVVSVIKNLYPKLEVFIITADECRARNIPFDMKSIPDVCVYNPRTKRFCFVEVKTDEGILQENQLERYLELGKTSDKFKGLIFTSPLGRMKGSIPFAHIGGTISKLKL